MKIFLLGARCLEEGANGGTKFPVNYYFLTNSQLSTNFG